jgi:hypothetical protein
MSEIPRQLPDWYFKPITFRHLLTFLTSEKSNLILKISNPATFSPQFHIITLLSLFPFSLSLHSVSLSSRSLSLCTLSLSLPGLTAFPQPLRLAPPCALPALSLAWPHLRLSHCRTTFSNPTPPEYHCPTLISGDPISSSGFTSWYSSYFSLFFLFVFILGIYLILFYFLVVWVYFYLKQSVDSMKWHQLICFSLSRSSFSLPSATSLAHRRPVSGAPHFRF